MQTFCAKLKFCGASTIADRVGLVGLYERESHSRGFVSILFPLKCTVLMETTTLGNFFKKMAATGGETIWKRVNFMIDIIQFY